MANEPKTRPSEQSVPAFIDAIEPEQKRKDARALAALMERVTGSPPQMWGPSIVGFGAYTYVNTSNKPAEWPLTAFSPRKANLTLYIMPGFSRYQSLLEKLGKHSTGKTCLYVKKLGDIDVEVIETLVADSVAHMREKYPTR